MIHLLQAAPVAVSVLPFVLVTVVFALGSLLSLAKRDVTWIDATVMIGLGILIGSTTVGVLVHGGLDSLGAVLHGSH